MSATSPINTSPLKTGVDQLPPAIPGEINGLAGVAFSGPIYSFNHSLDSKTKFPPHLNNTWLGWDFDVSPHPLWIFTLDSNSWKVTKQTRADNGLFSGTPLRRPTNMEYGPDGALYILNYDGFYSTVNPGVVRIDYVGSCHLPVKPEPSAVLPEKDFSIRLSQAGLFVGEAGTHEMDLHDLAGKRILSRKGGQGAHYSFRDLRPGAGEPVIHIVRVKTKRGLFLRKIAL